MSSGMNEAETRLTYIDPELRSKHGVRIQQPNKNQAGIPGHSWKNEGHGGEETPFS